MQTYKELITKVLLADLKDFSIPGTHFNKE